jgi:hypothetical protein
VADDTRTQNVPLSSGAELDRLVAQALTRPPRDARRLDDFRRWLADRLDLSTYGQIGANVWNETRQDTTRRQLLSTNLALVVFLLQVPLEHAERVCTEQLKAGFGRCIGLCVQGAEGRWELSRVLHVPEDSLASKLKPLFPDADLRLVRPDTSTQSSELPHRRASGPLFSPAAFDLLRGLQANPTHALYKENEAAFRNEVVDPFQVLFQRAVSLLRDEILGFMEHQQRVFSRIVKNDYGRGGAWPFYWGAIYPKGDQRTRSAQLYVWLNGAQLEFGFYIGQYGPEQRTRFAANCWEHLDLLLDMMADQLAPMQLRYGERPEFTGGSTDERASSPRLAWDEWLRDPSAFGLQAAAVVPADRAMDASIEALASRIVQVFEGLFPLVYLATDDDPMGRIAEYLQPPDSPVVTHRNLPIRWNAALRIPGSTRRHSLDGYAPSTVRARLSYMDRQGLGRPSSPSAWRTTSWAAPTAPTTISRWNPTASPISSSSIPPTSTRTSSRAFAPRPGRTAV